MRFFVCRMFTTFNQNILSSTNRLHQTNSGWVYRLVLGHDLIIVIAFRAAVDGLYIKIVFRGRSRTDNNMDLFSLVIVFLLVRSS